MRGGKAKTKGKSKTRKVARSIMGSLMSPIDVTSSSHLGDLEKRIKTGPLTLVLVYADWCGHCQRFKPMMSQLEKLGNRSIQMARVRDDVFPQSSLAAKNKVEGYPSLLLVNSAGSAMNFKQPSGEVSNTVPEHTDMTKMTALVRTAGTPEGLNLLNTMNQKNSAKSGASTNNAVGDMNVASLNTVKPVIANTSISFKNNNKKNNSLNFNNNGRNTNASMELLNETAEPLENVETVEPLTGSNLTTEVSLQANSAPKNIVADRLSATNVLSQNATLANSQNKTVRNLTQKGGSASGLGAENFCGSSCSVPHSQSGGGGLFGALSAAATNLAPATALFLAAEAVRKRSKKTRRQRRQRGGCGCGLSRRNGRI